MLLAALAVAAAAPPPVVITLPAPVVTPALPPGLAATKDRQRRSVLPRGGSATDTEVVTVLLGPDGVPSGVTVDQRLRLTGTGDFVVVERGPARHAVPLDGSDPPTLVFGAVLYSGYIPPTGRDLHAELTLDPVLEAARLPLQVTLSFTPRGSSQPEPLAPGGRIPGPGTVTVTLTNSSAVQADLPAGIGAGPVVAAALDALRTTVAGRPPAAGDGLPTTIAARQVGDTVATTVVTPLRVTGTVDGPPGSTLSGPGVTGDALAGTLSGPASFTLDVPAAGALHLDLSAVPGLDPRTLTPPGGAATWTAWAAQPRTDAELAAATTTLVTAAAVSAHVRDLSPYLTTDLTGQASTTFHLTLAPAAAVRAVAAPLHARPGAIALAGIAVLLLGADLELLRRRVISPAGPSAAPAAARRR